MTSLALIILFLTHMVPTGATNSTPTTQGYLLTSNISDTNNNDNVRPPELHKVRPRSEHPLAKAWLVDSAVGVIGIFFNSFELFVFYRERHHMINSVNVMIWSEHL